MTENTSPLPPPDSSDARRTYAPPSLTVHGTVENLTENASGADGSGFRA